MESYKQIAKDCAAQEKRYVFDTFSREDAMALGKLVADIARENYGARA